MGDGDSTTRALRGPEVLLVGGWDGARFVHRHPDLPGLAVESSPRTAWGGLDLALAWPARLPGRAVVDVAALPEVWARLKVGGVVVPAEVRRCDHRAVVLRWLDAGGSSTAAPLAGSAALAASVLDAVAGAAWSVLQRRPAQGVR